MNRQFKFRVWDGERFHLPNENGYEWSIGVCGEVRYPSGNLCDKAIVQQFTGLTDKNGKEIYEGDAVICENFVYSVIWDKTEIGWRFKVPKGSDTTIPIITPCPYLLASTVIVGNIFQNT